MTVQDNIAAKEKAMQDVRDHCMCANLEKGLVTFPDGHFPQGVRFHDNAKGYQYALEVMERTWLESFL